MSDDRILVDQELLRLAALYPHLKEAIEFARTGLPTSETTIEVEPPPPTENVPNYDEYGRLIFKDHPPTPEELAGNSIGYCYMSNDTNVGPGTIKDMTDGHSQ